MAGNNGNGAANLALGRDGGDRYASTKAIKEKMAVALAEAFSEAEIREFYGLKKGAIISDARRAKMARAKVGPTYKAMIAAMSAASMERLDVEVNKPGSMVWKLDRSSGLNLGGVLRIGAIEGKSFRLRACDDNSVWLSDRGIVPYRVPGHARGLYVRMAPSGWNGYKSAFVGAGWVVPFEPTESGAVDDGLLWGPIDGGAFGAMVSVPYPIPGFAGGVTTMRINLSLQASRDKETGLEYVWAYDDILDGKKKRVVWRGSGGMRTKLRIKALVLDTFFFELNGVPV